jgi:cytochrome c oxidase cbb3-type subunit 3
MHSRFRELAAIALAIALGACGREDRDFRPPPIPSPAGAATVSGLRPGGTPPPAPSNPYANNAWALSEGKRLYESFNCVGCHAHGGGGMGPPLMDAQWIYGAEPANVFASIVEGRPNGMPSFRGKVTDDQVWMLAAYVRSMAGLARPDAAPSRSDHMSAAPPEQSRTREPPRDASMPPAAQGTQ